VAIKSTAHLCFCIILDRFVGVKVSTAGNAGAKRNRREFYNPERPFSHSVEQLTGD
jgi:hypothetical protein